MFGLHFANDVDVVSAPEITLSFSPPILLKELLAVVLVALKEEKPPYIKRLLQGEG